MEDELDGKRRDANGVDTNFDLKAKQEQWNLLNQQQADEWDELAW